jgi:type IV pilus assembly protein PilW
MSTARFDSILRSPHLARGFTIVELLVTIAIALFLLGGLVTIVTSVRRTYADQQALAQLQDQQRFAITLLTDVIQSGGYYDSAGTSTNLTAFPISAPYTSLGQAFAGTQGAAAPAAGDSIYVRYRTYGGDGIINCQGTSNTGTTEQVYSNEFYVNAATQQLMCSVNGGTPVALVNGVVNLTIYYGVKRQTPATDYNVDTYEQANAAVDDWMDVSAVRVIVTFNNPLWGAPNQPVKQLSPYIVVERVIQVMSRAGDYT